jgi:transmembrane sensor
VLALAGVVALILALRLPGATAYRTAVGEQRLIVLEDGSHMLLNTDTRLRVDFRAAQRTVEVSTGEVFFEVAKDAQRPFVVRVAGSEVVAVGTAFSVRYAPTGRLPQELAVTLVEGHVKVRSARSSDADALAPTESVLMDAGERLVLDRVKRQASVNVVAAVDRPNVEQVLAWKVREASFNDTPLADAVAEMNRYNRTKIVLVNGLATSDLRVSGMYRVDDIAGFAHAVATLHNLALDDTDGRVELVKPN